MQVKKTFLFLERVSSSFFLVFSFDTPSLDLEFWLHSMYQFEQEPIENF